MPGMGNRSRVGHHRTPWVDGDRRDPLCGIQDTNMPGLATIRLARALSGRQDLHRRPLFRLGLLLMAASSGLTTIVLLVLAVR
jgi:hypothetical protein